MHYLTYAPIICQFFPVSLNSFKEENLINRAIQSNYEMGSTFKPLTVAMGYDKDIISPNMKFDVTKSIKGINDYLEFEGDGIYNIEKIINELEEMLNDPKNKSDHELLNKKLEEIQFLEIEYLDLLEEKDNLNI